MKMLDYVQLAHVRMGENLERSSELVGQLVDIFSPHPLVHCASSHRVRPVTPPIVPAITCKTHCRCRCPL